MESFIMQGYFKEIEKKILAAHKLASEARKKGYDPETKVDIPLAKNMAERVEGLISVAAPQLVGKGITKRIQELEKKYTSSWHIALTIAKEVAQQRFCKFKDKLEAMEVGIRTGFAYHTNGIVAAPLEGFTGLTVKKRKDGREFIAIKYSGPIRGAGGTAAAFSVVIADYVRKTMGYSAFDPTENEINRYVTELEDYHEKVTNLQYKPSEEEIRFLIRHIPVQIDGDPTEKFEVSNYKDLERIETNRIRGGVCLVVSMASLKAPKLWKGLLKLKDIDIDWEFMEEYLNIQKKKKAQLTEIEIKKEKITPDYTYISDMVAGRPVLTHPLRMGGFRLRYGRSRASGYSATSIHPATMAVLNKYVATGTQLKVERPGKATTVTVCDTIDGPIVKLEDGSVVKLETELQAKQIINQIKEIIFLGDILISYGDFYDRAHPLVPAGYSEEWWIQELEKATVNTFGTLDIDKLSELVEINKKKIQQLLKKPLETQISPKEALNISKKLEIPLHPYYTFFWSAATTEDILLLIDELLKANIIMEENFTKKIIIPGKNNVKNILEKIGLPYVFASNEFIVIEKPYANIILSVLGLQNKKFDSIKKIIEQNNTKNTLDLINFLSEIKVMDKGGTFIGARMGRPEKAKERKLTGSPNVLFPVGEEGGRLRSFQAAMEIGKVTADFPMFLCYKCNSQTIWPVCEHCDKKTVKVYECKFCGLIKEPCQKHKNTISFKKKTIDINYYFKESLKKIGVKVLPDLIKGVRGTSSKDHLSEHIIKGILRAKHSIHVNKDGTTRYDMTEVPLTHFKPKEVNTTIEQLKELGYTKDMKNKDLENEEQLLELKPQDVILPATPNSLDEPADMFLFRVAKFIDELLIKLYGVKPFYNIKSKNGLIGHLVVGLAPHISAGTVGRIIGFSQTQGFFAHPLFHAALRRDCDGDEACVILLMDAFLNFSRQYLPDKIGGRTMDAPLVLTSKIIPAEVDDMVHRLDIQWKYPLEFYKAASEYKQPWDVEIELLGNKLNTEKQYEGMGFTHSVSDINQGVICSAYKTIPSMEDKLKGQMDLAEKIRAVDASDVAALVIEKHFLKDTKGNLRKFSIQQFRCVKCNEKFRRPPLIGKCTNCGGRIIFTISQGSVVKYLEPSISLAKKYEVPVYLKQSLELLKRRVEGVFGKEKEKQIGLGQWF